MLPYETDAIGIVSRRSDGLDIDILGTRKFQRGPDQSAGFIDDPQAVAGQGDLFADPSTLLQGQLDPGYGVSLVI